MRARGKGRRRRRCRHGARGSIPAALTAAAAADDGPAAADNPIVVQCVVQWLLGLRLDERLGDEDPAKGDAAGSRQTEEEAKERAEERKLWAPAWVRAVVATADFAAIGALARSSRATRQHVSAIELWCPLYAAFAGGGEKGYRNAWDQESSSSFLDHSAEDMRRQTWAGETGLLPCFAAAALPSAAPRWMSACGMLLGTSCHFCGAMTGQASPLALVRVCASCVPLRREVWTVTVERARASGLLTDAELRTVPAIDVSALEATALGAGATAGAGGAAAAGKGEAEGDGEPSRCARALGTSRVLSLQGLMLKAAGKKTRAPTNEDWEALRHDVQHGASPCDALPLGFVIRGRDAWGRDLDESGRRPTEDERSADVSWLVPPYIAPPREGQGHDEPIISGPGRPLMWAVRLRHGLEGARMMECGWWSSTWEEMTVDGAVGADVGAFSAALPSSETMRRLATVRFDEEVEEEEPVRIPARLATPAFWAARGEAEKRRRREFEAAADARVPLAHAELQAMLAAVSEHHMETRSCRNEESWTNDGRTACRFRIQQAVFALDVFDSDGGRGEHSNYATLICQHGACPPLRLFAGHGQTGAAYGGEEAERRHVLRLMAALGLRHASVVEFLGAILAVADGNKRLQYNRGENPCPTGRSPLFQSEFGSYGETPTLFAAIRLIHTDGLRLRLGGDDGYY